ncbi:uncharacterized [Tachysurus ichikawai]
MERRLSDSRAGRGSPHRAFGSETNVAGYFLTRKTPQPIREQPRWSTFESPNMPRVSVFICGDLPGISLTGALAK